MPDSCGEVLAGSVEPQSVPSTMVSIMDQSLRSKASMDGPAKHCQTLVIKEGSTSKEAAEAGDITRPSKLMATVGRPMPVMPLTMPAIRKMALSRRRKERDSCMPVLKRGRQVHTLWI